MLINASSGCSDHLHATGNVLPPSDFEEMIWAGRWVNMLCVMHNDNNTASAAYFGPKEFILINMRNVLY